MKINLVKLATIISLALSAIVFVAIITIIVTRQLKANIYYSFFLDNNQVYFGKIVSKNKEFITLSDVHYLKIDKNITAENSTDLALYKMGSELHSPKGEISINVLHIIYYGELRDNSQIVQIIKSKNNE